MSRGLGAKQREIIKIGGAAACIFDCVPELTYKCSSLTERAGWRRAECRDGKSRWFSEQTAHSPEEVDALRASCDAVWFDYWENPIKQYAQALVPCAMSWSHIIVTLYPGLFDVDYRDTRWDEKAGRSIVRVPEDILRQKRSAEATVRRSMETMVSRGLLAGSCSGDWRDWQEAIASRGWKSKYTKDSNFYFALRPAATVAGKTACELLSA